VRLRFALAALALALAGCGGTPEAPERYDWPHYGGQYDEAGYAALDSIHTGNVGDLGLAWSLELPGQHSLEATPLAVDGVLYFTGSYGDVFAVSVETGQLLWKHEVKVYEANPDKMNYIFPLNRGTAFADGKVFSATTDGRLIALDAKSGEELWSTLTVSRNDKRYITGAPRAFKGLVVIGQGGGDVGERGYVTAYDQETGRQVWRFYTAPGSPAENAGDPAMEMAAKTWKGEWWKTGTGGTVWHGMTYDPELDQLYIGTGNSGPYDPEIRSPGGGDNLFLASIVALDAETGKYKWHYQVNPREAWDYKATAGIVTATLDIDGEPRKVLMQAPTNGFFYVLDRETGELVNEPKKIGKVTWASGIDMETGRPIEAEGIRYESGETTIWPSPAGAHNWQAMSYNPQTGLVYIPYMEMGMRFVKAPGSFLGVSFAPAETDDPREGKGALIAWDPVKQEPRWKVWHDWMWNGGTLTTAGNLVFQGTADGWLTAYDARDGKRLWRFNAGLGIIAPPISYSWKGTQYVSILVGWAGAKGTPPSGWRFNAQPRRLLTFRLGGMATLPATAPYDETVYPLDDTALELDPEDVAAGMALYHKDMVGCDNCHGPLVRSTGSPGPDLRESQIALDPDALWSVLHDGALLEKGMPRYPDFTREQVNQLYAYIRSTARDELTRQAAEKAGKPVAEQERRAGTI
jgi:quinohemoprotein ethanol dehydrogenase